MNSELIDKAFTCDPMQVTINCKSGRKIMIKDFIQLPEKEMFHVLGLTAESFAEIPDNEGIWYVIVVNIIRALKLQEKEKE